ncbi:hypothetical protein FBU30_002917 [Linnemannia zychae]|nr:hypothetical protein FBU30_002917 [Linnemannia zychae]
MEVSTTEEVNPTTTTAPPPEAPTMPQSSTATATSVEGAGSVSEGVSKDEISFVDLVFDTILLEESTVHRSRVAPVRTVYNNKQPILVPLSFARLSEALEIAQTVCHDYHEKHPGHSFSLLAEKEFEAAGLSDVDRLKAYVHLIGGCNNFFLKGGTEKYAAIAGSSIDQPESKKEHQDRKEIDSKQQQQSEDHGQLCLSYPQQNHEDLTDQRKSSIVFSPGNLFESKGYSIPALNENQVKRFNTRYYQLNPEYQDMVARVMFKLRNDFWDRPIINLDAGIESRLLATYSSSTAQRRREDLVKKQAEKVKGIPEAEMNQAATRYLDEIRDQLKGLQIVQAGKEGSGKKPTFGLQGMFDLPLVLPTKDAYKAVSDGIMNLYQKLVPSQDYMIRRTKLVQRLQGILNSGFPGQDLRLEVFGSYASGLGSESSDADLCITTEHFKKTAPYNNVRLVAQILRQGGMTQVQPIADARVPIVKFVDPVTKTRCDMNTNHVLGIHNSELIRCYTMIDERVRPFLYSLKALVKKHGINDSSQSWLSSYAYVMMAIGFLQAQEPPILPSLQDQPEERMSELYIQMNHEGRGGRDVINCTFDRNPGQYANFGAANTKSVGQLLIEFFEYYSRFYDYQTMEVNVRCGGGIRLREELTKARKNGNPNVRPPQRGRGEKKLIVMDPFILDRNVAGMCTGRHLLKVWRIFESLYLTLSRGDFTGAFATIEKHEDEEEHFKGRLRGGLPPAQQRMVAKKYTQSQAKVAARPSTPVQAQTLPTRPIQTETTAVTTTSVHVHGQSQGQGQIRSVNGSGLTESHRSREKKTERKLERKQSKREQQEAAKALRKLQAASSSSRISTATVTATSTATTTVAMSASVDIISSPAITGVDQKMVQGLAATEVNGVPSDVDGDDDEGDDDDSQQSAPEGGSKSRKRRQRRSVARALHSAAAAAAAAAISTTTNDTLISAPIPAHEKSNSEETAAATVFASAVAQATNFANSKSTTIPPQHNISNSSAGSITHAKTHEISNNSSSNKSAVNQKTTDDKFAQKLQQQQQRLQEQQMQKQQQKKLQKQQKQANKQLNRQQYKQDQQQQQTQQLNPQFPVLAKTHKLLFSKTKESNNSSSSGKLNGPKSKEVMNNGVKSSDGGNISSSKRQSRVQSKSQPAATVFVPLVSLGH